MLRLEYEEYKVNQNMINYNIEIIKNDVLVKEIKSDRRLSDNELKELVLLEIENWLFIREVSMKLGTFLFFIIVKISYLC